MESSREVPVFSPEDRKSMENAIDFREIQLLSTQIQENAVKCSEIAKRRQEEGLTEEQQDALGEELVVLVDEGFELAKQRASLVIRSQ